MHVQQSAARAARPQRVPVLGVGIDPVTMEQAVALVSGWTLEPAPRLIVTPNAEIVHRAVTDTELAAVIARADLVIADGAGVVLGAKLAGRWLPERVPGVDMAAGVMRELAKRRGSVFVLGGSPESNSRCMARLPDLFPGLRVVGGYHGFFKPEDEAGIIAQIAVAQPDFLLCGMGAPRQEKWLAAHLHALDGAVCIGIGGGIDVWAGMAQRAPEWMQRANLEWLHRTVKMNRYRRVLPTLLRFLWAAILDR